MNKDAQGHAVSGATPEAIARFDEAVRAFTLVYGDPAGELDAAREAAPEFTMAHLVKAWLFTLAFDPALAPPAQVLMQTAATLPMDDREHGHLAALTQAAAGERSAAVAILDRHLMHFPRDIVAHQAANVLDGFLGRFSFVRARAARALPFWSNAQSGYPTMRAYHGFGLEEAGDYARAEDESRVAAELEPHGFWPHHTVAHVMEMTGRPDVGLRWMDEREALWSGPGHLNEVHVWWHKALFHVEQGQYDAALTLHDGPIRDTGRRLALHLTNATALLWRLDLLGCDVGDRWHDAAPQWEGHADGACLPFADIHAAMAELRTGQEARVEQRLARMRRTSARDGEAAACYRDVAVPVVEGLFAFHRGDHPQAVERLHPVRVELSRIGGSHAQRDIVDWTLTEAALRGGMREVALSLAYERLDARPRSVVNQQFLRRAQQLAA